jgi:hypothetical protein
MSSLFEFLDDLCQSLLAVFAQNALDVDWVLGIELFEHLAEVLHFICYIYFDNILLIYLCNECTLLSGIRDSFLNSKSSPVTTFS